MSELPIPTPPPQPALSQASHSEQNTDEPFLRLQLVLNTAILLPVQQLAEVLTVDMSQIMPIPHMPAWVMGIYNWRGEVLWMVDLGHLCGLPPWYQQKAGSLHAAVVLNVSAAGSTAMGNQPLGLVVDRIEDVEWCAPEQIQPISSASVVSELSQFLRGYWWKSNDDALAVLDGNAILAAMPQP